MACKTISKVGLQNLRTAILAQAVTDYKNALDGKPVSTTISENGKIVGKRTQAYCSAKSLERFFKSEWGEWLSFGKGQYIIEKSRRDVINSRIIADNKSVALNLKALRKKHGITITETAELFHMSPATINKYEKELRVLNGDRKIEFMKKLKEVDRKLERKKENAED